MIFPRFGGHTAAGIYMVNYKGEYGVAVDARADTGGLGSLPQTGGNELDSREALMLNSN